MTIFVKSLISVFSVAALSLTGVIGVKYINKLNDEERLRRAIIEEVEEFNRRAPEREAEFKKLSEQRAKEWEEVKRQQQERMATIGQRYGLRGIDDLIPEQYRLRTSRPGIG